MNRYKWLRVPIALGALCVLATIGGVSLVRSGDFDISTSIPGDTLSLITKVAADSTFKSSYDCCQFTIGSVADTTRPIFVLGASMVRLHFHAKVAGGDTNTTFVWHVTGLQTSGDSTNWTSENVGGATENPGQLVSIDTTSTTLAVTWTASGTAGWEREARIVPIPASKATGSYAEWTQGGLGAPNHLGFKWLRVILTRSWIGPHRAGPYTLRLDSYIYRDETGKALAARAKNY